MVDFSAISAKISAVLRGKDDDFLSVREAGKGKADDVQAGRTAAENGKRIVQK